MAIWPTRAATDADLYVAVNALQTTLAGNISNSVTTVPITNTTNFPTAGGVTIDQEVIFYTGISGGNLTGCTRGADGTVAASHTSGVPVSHTIIAFHHNGLMYEIEAIESWLLTNAVSNPALGNIAMAGFKLTGLGAGTTAGDSVRYEQLFGAFLPLGGGTLTGNLVIPVGSAVAPSLSFAGDTITGLFQNGAGNLGFSGGGSMAAQARSNGMEMGSGKIFQFADGTQAAPSITFSSDNTLGLAHETTGQMTFVYNNASLLRLRGVTGDARFSLDVVAPAHSSLGSATDYWGALYVKGTQTNDSAASGFLGEYVVSTTSATNLPGNAVYGDGASITLSAGDWDVTGTANYLANGATVTRNLFGISTTSGNSSTGLVNGDTAYDTSIPLAATRGAGGSLQIRASLSGSTTYYLKVYGEYTGATEQYTCSIRARRAR